MAIERTKKDNQAAIDRLAYEIRMLSRTASALNRLPTYERTWIVNNAVIHSFLLATRNLLEFFFPGKNKYNDTIYAETFVTPWEHIKPKFKEGVHWHRVDENEPSPPCDVSFESIISQRLHHITWHRVSESKLNWHEPEISIEFHDPVLAFQAALPSDWRTDLFEETVQEFDETCKRFEDKKNM